MANPNVRNINVKFVDFETKNIDDVKAAADEMYSTAHGALPTVFSSIKLFRSTWSVSAIVFASNDDFQDFVKLWAKVKPF